MERGTDQVADVGQRISSLILPLTPAPNDDDNDDDSSGSGGDDDDDDRDVDDDDDDGGDDDDDDDVQKDIATWMRR